MIWIYAAAVLALVLVTALVTRGVIVSAWEKGWRAPDSKCPYAVETWRGQAWERGAAAQRARQLAAATEATACHLEAHLYALAGAEQVVLARRHVPAPAPPLALLLAENSYLIHSGWTRFPERDVSHGEAWAPPWDASVAFERTRALSHQRQRDRNRDAAPLLRGA